MSSNLDPRLTGAAIQSAINGLKRTTQTVADDLGLPLSEIQAVVDGQASPESARKLAFQLEEKYPIKSGTLCFSEDDCENGVKFMTAEQAEKTKRVYDRKNKDGELTPYYDYRDGAMSINGPLKPEWIRELRDVNNDDPENPDVAYNNGHSEHQMTFFIGEVNFYYEKDGKKFCEKMKTGDSNYITPVHPHSFARPDPNKESLIMAITFEGDVIRAQKEIYSLGLERTKEFVLPYKDSKNARIRLLETHLNNEKMSLARLEKLLKEKGIEYNDDNLGDPQVLKTISEILNIEPGDLQIPEFSEEKEVVVKHKDESESYVYPSEEKQLYKLNPLARTSKLPLMKGFDIQVLSQNTPEAENFFRDQLHNFIYNYGSAPVKVDWIHQGQKHDRTLNPGDSIYIQPYVSYAFSNPTNSDARVVSLGVPGSVNLIVQKELSQMSDVKRAAGENTQWFN